MGLLDLKQSLGERLLSLITTLLNAYFISCLLFVLCAIVFL